MNKFENRKHESGEPAEDVTELAWQEISREHLIQDEWIDFRRSAYRYPDGRIYQPFYTYSRRDYAVIVASDREGKYLCVRQFRQGIRRVTTEFPAGGIEDRDAAGTPEDRTARALAAAQRELREETGYESDRWTHLLTVPSNATISDNLAYLFAATLFSNVLPTTLFHLYHVIAKLRAYRLGNLVNAK